MNRSNLRPSKSQTLGDGDGEGESQTRLSHAFETFQGKILNIPENRGAIYNVGPPSYKMVYKPH